MRQISTFIDLRFDKKEATSSAPLGVEDVAVLLILRNFLFLPRMAFTIGTAHIPCSARMHCEKHAAVLWNMSVSALLAFIVPRLLLDF